MKRSADVVDVVDKTTPSPQTKKAKPSEPSRALFMGGLSAECLYYDVCKLANQHGALECAKLVPGKHCAFLNFLEQSSAQSLYDHAQANPVKMNDRDITIGWAKAGPLDPKITEAVAKGATRNLFVARLDSSGMPLSEAALDHVFGRYGPVENVSVIVKKGIAFVNLTNIKQAMAAVADSTTEPGLAFAGQRLVVKYAKEIGVTSRDPRTRPPSQHVMMPMGSGMPNRPPQMPHVPVAPGYPGQPDHPSMPMPMPFGSPALPPPVGPRAVYVGNVPATTSYSDVCRVANHFGQVESISLNLEKHNAFINFVEPGPAASMLQHHQTKPLTIGTTECRVASAKSTPINPSILAAVRQGASRNLYVGGIPEDATEEQLKDLFGPFSQGHYDSIKLIPDKKVAFVNLCDVKSAIAAKEHFAAAQPPIRLGTSVLRVNFAKERITG